MEWYWSAVAWKQHDSKSMLSLNRLVVGLCSGANRLSEECQSCSGNVVAVVSFGSSSNFDL